MSESKALMKRSADTQLMPPPPPPKRIKRPPVVLDEETYTSALSHIIARDFFPGLLESDAQQEYLDALDSNNPEWIQEAEMNVRVAMTPVQGRRRSERLVRTPTLGNTPWRGVGGETPRDLAGGETPATVHAGATPSRSTVEETSSVDGPKVDLNLSLSAFQAKYTSEDNESFHKIMDKQAIKNRTNNPWLWNGNKLPSKQQIAQAAQRQRVLASAPNPEQSLALTSAQDNDKDKRAPMLTFRPPTKTPYNSLMFQPEDVTSTHPDVTPVAKKAQASSSAPPKSVNHNATRFSLPSVEQTASVPPSPSLSAIDAAIAGFPRHRADSTIAGSDAGDGSETPLVNGYAFVDAEPTPSEVDAFQSDMSRTSILLAAMRSSDSDSTNPFTIADSSRRETLHHRLVDKQLASKRVKGREAELRRQEGKTPTPSFASSPRAGLRGSAAKASPGSMTPAAQALFEKMGGGRTPARERDVSAFDGVKAKGKGSWTPTPLRVKKAN